MCLVLSSESRRCCCKTSDAAAAAELLLLLVLPSQGSNSAFTHVMPKKWPLFAR
jgi:hypothetical protein